MTKDRDQDIRDALLVEMARGIQFLLAQSDAEELRLPRRHTIIGRIESHVELLQRG